MDELKKYVDDLFLHKPLTTEAKELKDEIYSNMLARKQDLINQGLTEKEAIQQAKESITSIDPMLEDQKSYYSNRFKTECWQTLLFYSIILWILSIPTIILDVQLFSFAAFLLTIMIAVIYLITKNNNQDTTAYIDRNHFIKLRKIAWVVWSIFFVMSIVTITALLFGSNIWFGRPVKINGPYQFGVMAVKYYVPAITALLPLALSSIPKILDHYVRMDGDE